MKCKICGQPVGKKDLCEIPEQPSLKGHEKCLKNVIKIMKEIVDSVKQEKGTMKMRSKKVLTEYRRVYPG